MTAVAAVDGMDRVLDPLVLRQIPAGRNISVGNGTEAALAALWGAVNASRVGARSHGPQAQPAPHGHAALSQPLTGGMVGIASSDTPAAARRPGPPPAAAALGQPDRPSCTHGTDCSCRSLRR